MSKLRKMFNLLLILTLVQAGCKKDESSSPNTTTTTGNEFETLPSAFTKKVLLEEYTGEWCVNCPDGAKYVHDILTKYPTQMIPVGVHQGDWLEFAQLGVLSTHLGGIGGYPRASINRTPATNTTNGQDGLVVYSRGNWESNVARQIDVNAPTGDLGLALESTITEGKLNVKVHVGYKETNMNDTRLTVYILENKITAIKQIGATTSPYIHEHTLRKVASSGLGDKIDLKTGNYKMVEFKDIDISSYQSSEVEVVAFINEVGSSSNKHKVLNVQAVKAGETKKYD
ncbi:MAG: Omp28-related outer membrane protein [Bacteroidia bacterium]|nr:Omp28-related outer membrane protein [Bacteroidia bacterium]MCF8425952.1 Omp28-related outer membrane protein [Bacteroidia bacterium]MCF8446285.1 Omp28-related outer membrane protein [Bacteroidia bacterium]